MNIGYLLATELIRVTTGISMDEIVTNEIEKDAH